MAKNKDPTSSGGSSSPKLNVPRRIYTESQQYPKTAIPGPSQAALGTSRPVHAVRFNMNILPGASRHNAAPASSESIETNSQLTKHLLPSRVKRRMTLPHFKSTKVDYAEEPSEDMVVTMEASDIYREQRDLLAAIRTLPAPMKEKRDYRDQLRQTLEMQHGELARLNIAFRKGRVKCQSFFDELFSKSTFWSTTFKTIEGRYGTGVVSFFVFLRWLLLMNVIIFLMTLVFVVLPQVVGELSKEVNITLIPEHDSFNETALLNLNLASKYTSKPKEPVTGNSLGSQLGIDLEALDHLESLLDTYTVDNFIGSTLHYSSKNYTIAMRHRLAAYCAEQYQKYVVQSTATDILARIQDFFQGTGWLQFTPLFMGFYEPYDVLFGTLVYSMPVAFLTILFIVLFISIIMMMLYASKGVQESMLERNLQETYCYLIFCGWDYCIAEEKTAGRQQKSIVQELTSTMAEERTEAKMQKWTTNHKAKVFSIRCAMNLLTLLFLVGSYYLIFYIAKLQLQIERASKSDEGFVALFSKFLPSITITGLNFIFPLILYILAQFEEYKMRHQINITLLRIIILRQASLIILISSFYHEITCEPKDMCLKGEDSCQSPICWETYVGQQMYRLTILDFFVHVLVVFLWETPRNYVVIKFKHPFVQYVGRQLFDIPTQVLAIVYSQTLCWLGMFYSPLIPGITVAKFIIFFYIKKYTVLRNCAPEQIPYKASRSNAIFVLVLMLSFFVTLAVLGFSVAQIAPSPGCSPYRLYDSMVHAVRDAIQQLSPEFSKVIIFAFSPLFIIPIIILLVLVLYYFITKASAHKKMVKLLKVQLTMQGKDKQFLLHRVTKLKPKADRVRFAKQD